MSKRELQAADEWVVTVALASALIALEQLEPKHQPTTHMSEVRQLLPQVISPERQSASTSSKVVVSQPGLSDDLSRIRSRSRELKTM
jgi:hypothetical protein